MNVVAISGNVSSRIEFASTGGGTPVCTFQMASDRHTRDTVITAWVKVNAYGRGLVEACRQKLTKGIYVVVEGELMNRDGRMGELLEVRARRVDFPNNNHES
jgi:single-stranded DNA-binding protein